MKRRVFMDTSYVQARINRRDGLHQKALGFAAQVEQTEA